MKINVFALCSYLFIPVLSTLYGETTYMASPKIRSKIVAKLKELDSIKILKNSNEIHKFLQKKIEKSDFFDQEQINLACKDISGTFKKFNFSCVLKGDYEKKEWLVLEIIFNKNRKFTQEDKDTIEILLPKVLKGIDFELKNVSFEYLKSLDTIMTQACKEKNLLILEKSMCPIQ